MTRPRLIGLTLACLALMALGSATSPRARQGDDRLEDPMPRGPAGLFNFYHVEAPPRTVTETRAWLKLQAAVPLNFPDGISLGDLVKLVRESTKDVAGGFPRGIPIYVDPMGLTDADMTMESKVTIDLDGVPLGKAFRLALQSLRLVVMLDKDGLLTITSGGCFDGLPIDHETATWRSLDALREDIQGLRAEVAELRRELKPSGRAAGPGPVDGPPASPGPPANAGGGFR